MHIAELLNKSRFKPSVDGGKVTLGRRQPDYTWQDATDEDLEALGDPDLCLDAHPEGAKRGGYVVWANVASGAATYSDGAGCWEEAG